MAKLSINPSLISLICVIFSYVKHCDLETLQTDTKIICYFASWANYRAPPMNYDIENIPGDLCTHVIYQYSSMDENSFEITPNDPGYDFGRRGYERFIALRQRWPNLKLMLSVGGWTEGGAKYSNMVSERRRRRSFISSVLTLFNNYTFDGLDLDWRYPGANDRQGKRTDKRNFLSLVRELRTEFDRRNLTLSSTGPLNDYRLRQGYEVTELSRLLDQIHLLSFDLRGHWGGYADVHSPLYPRSFDKGSLAKLNARDGLQLWASMGAPKHKLILGVPFYGRSYTLSNGNKNGLKSKIRNWNEPGKPGNFTESGGMLAYYEICSSIRSNNWTRRWDDEGKVPYAFYRDQWVGYEDEDSIAAKMEFIRDNGYGGVMVWSLDMDDFNSVCGTKNALLNEINDDLQGYQVMSTESSSSSSISPSTSSTEMSNLVEDTSTLVPGTGDNEIAITLSQDFWRSLMTKAVDQRKRNY